MSEELSVQTSIEMMMWERLRDDASYPKHVLARMREQLGVAILKALDEGWIVSSPVTTSEFDSIRHYSGDMGWFYQPPPEPVENSRAWPPRRVFVMAVRMDKPIVTQDRFGMPIVALTQDATRPPDPIYDEWSRTPWASDVWPPTDADYHGSTRAT